VCVMASNRRGRAAVDESSPDAQTRAVGPDDTGRPAYDREAVDDPRAAGHAAEERESAPGDREGIYYGGYGSAAGQRDAERGAADQAVMDRDGVSERHPVIDPNAREGDVVTEPAPRTRRVRARGSLATTIGLIVSVVALCAALTGLLAPEGLVLGIVGVLISLGGVRGSRRDGVTGSAAATFSIVIALVGVVIAVVAMTGQFTWPNSRTDQIQVWHDWLVAHWSTLDRW